MRHEATHDQAQEIRSQGCKCFEVKLKAQCVKELTLNHCGNVGHDQQVEHWAVHQVINEHLHVMSTSCEGSATLEE